jgi:hypothetical protein
MLSKLYQVQKRWKLRKLGGLSEAALAIALYSIEISIP